MYSTWNILQLKAELRKRGATSTGKKANLIGSYHQEFKVSYSSVLLSSNFFKGNMKENLSLSWDAHQKNLCSGLTLLQQQGEFVDMTLAADGHHVKVHQMIMSLASPYIKSLITTAQCPHPVIVLSNISHKTLVSILEYIYTGEVHITRDELPNLIVAGKALQIKGLQEMDDNIPTLPNDGKESQKISKSMKKDDFTQNPRAKSFCEVFVESDANAEMRYESMDTTFDGEDHDTADLSSRTNHSLETNKKEYCNPADVNYSISTQGNLQLVVNRYIYNLKYVQKNLSKYWRCVDYAYRKCPASIYTSNSDVVLKRKCTHNHPFHDSKILKKIRNDLIFKGFNEAKNKAEDKKSSDTVELLLSQTEQQIDDSE